MIITDMVELALRERLEPQHQDVANCNAEQFRPKQSDRGPAQHLGCHELTLKIGVVLLLHPVTRSPDQGSRQVLKKVRVRVETMNRFGQRSSAGTDTCVPVVLKIHGSGALRTPVERCCQPCRG